MERKWGRRCERERGGAKEKAENGVCYCIRDPLFITTSAFGELRTRQSWILKSAYNIPPECYLDTDYYTNLFSRLFSQSASHLKDHSSHHNTLAQTVNESNPSRDMVRHKKGLWVEGSGRELSPATAALRNDC